MILVNRDRLLRFNYWRKTSGRYCGFTWIYQGFYNNGEYHNFKVIRDGGHQFLELHAKDNMTIMQLIEDGIEEYFDQLLVGCIISEAKKKARERQ